MQCVWETESLKTQIHWARRKKKKGVLDRERLEIPVVDIHGALQLRTEDLCDQRPVGATTRDRRLGPFKALLPATKPQAFAGEDMHY